MRISRDRYLEKIRKVMGNGLVKVITGIRRCGKSYFIFNIFREYLLSNGVAEEQIIEVHLDEAEYAGLRKPRELLKYVKEMLVADGRQNYVLIDEIQECRPGSDDDVDFYDVLSSPMKRS